MKITARQMEIKIFEFLTSGCATYHEIKVYLNGIFHNQIGDVALYKTLSLLRKNRLIQSSKYFDREKRRNFTLYANTEHSIEVLVRESDYLLNHIRSPYLPGRYAFWHEMDLTKMVRTIKLEEPKYLYHFSFRDEVALKRSSDKTKKGDLYPDLELTIKLRDGNEYFFRIEVDRGTVRAYEFALKLSKSENNLVLCKTSGRIYDITTSRNV